MHQIFREFLYFVVLTLEKQNINRKISSCVLLVHLNVHYDSNDIDKACSHGPRISYAAIIVPLSHTLDVLCECVCICDARIDWPQARIKYNYRNMLKFNTQSLGSARFFSLSITLYKTQAKPIKCCNFVLLR